MDNQISYAYAHKALSLIDGAFYHMIKILFINSILALTNSRRMLQ